MRRLGLLSLSCCSMRGSSLRSYSTDEKAETTTDKRNASPVVPPTAPPTLQPIPQYPKPQLIRLEVAAQRHLTKTQQRRLREAGFPATSPFVIAGVGTPKKSAVGVVLSFKTGEGLVYTERYYNVEELEEGVSLIHNVHKERRVSQAKEDEWRKTAAKLF